MELIYNFPCFSLILSMCAAIVSSGLKGKWARRLNLFVICTICVLSACTLYFTFVTGQSYVYKMGRFPAPWGNEIRFGNLEALTALFFSVVMLLCILGGRKHLFTEVDPFKENLYYVLSNLLLSSLLALVYTNDMFTAYVFVEINTISACGLIMIRENGHTLEAAVRYMVMSLIGSGLLLFGLCILYGITGHLLMSNIKEQVTILARTGGYHIPLVIAIIFVGVGLAVKSALFPFHSWLPDSYGYSTVSSAAILSSLVSKGYLFLLIKFFYRVIGFEVIAESRLFNVFFVFGLCGMIFGSISAIRENDIRRMIAFSSVAQVGYIYMGFGLGIEAGMIAAIFHIFSHGATKSLLFISASGLSDVSGNSKKFGELTGAGYRNVIAGAAFTVGALSMVGVPLFSGFISKILFARAGVMVGIKKMLPTLICLAVSTILNTIYFMKTVLRIYTPVKNEYQPKKWKEDILYGTVCLLFIGLNIFLGMYSEPIVELIRSGLSVFS
ncbi:MAG: sodium:proton antiporter [Lachnospiraceae bacterium]|nr:sodium:proton antiporter [Lachnospiraceae bacterium]